MIGIRYPRPLIRFRAATAPAASADAGSPVYGLRPQIIRLFTYQGSAKI